MAFVDILFSYTVLGAILFLLAVVAASYAGTRIALSRFFDGRRNGDA